MFNIPDSNPSTPNDGKKPRFSGFAATPPGEPRGLSAFESFKPSRTSAKDLSKLSNSQLFDFDEDKEDDSEKIDQAQKSKDSAPETPVKDNEDLIAFSTTKKPAPGPSSLFPFSNQPTSHNQSKSLFAEPKPAPVTEKPFAGFATNAQNTGQNKDTETDDDDFDFFPRARPSKGKGPEAPNLDGDSIFSQPRNKMPDFSGLFSQPSRTKRPSPKLQEYPSMKQPFVSPIQPKATIPQVRTQIKRRTMKSKYPSLAYDISSQKEPAAISEHPGLILGTEDIVSRMWDSIPANEQDDEKLASTLSNATRDLIQIWNAYASDATKGSGFFGASNSFGRLSQAEFLASILLSLHHPQTKTVDFSGGLLSGLQGIVSSIGQSGKGSIPKVLLDWLNRHYNHVFDSLRDLQSYSPNPTASPHFWSIVHSLVLRGQFSTAIDLLNTADFNHARSALEDGLEKPGYRGSQLQNTQHCVNKAVQCLRSSPTAKANWNIQSLEWNVYRQELSSAIQDLDALVDTDAFHSDSKGEDDIFGGFPLVPENRGHLTFTQAARMADSRIPLSVYKQLKIMYNILLGNVDTIMEVAQDWIDGTIALTSWWSGPEGNTNSEAESARLLHIQRAGYSSKSAESNTKAYFQRLDDALFTLTESNPGKFAINPLNHREIGLACVFQGDVDGVVRLLETWSLPIASAVVEIASCANWLETRPLSPLDPNTPGLTATDLMTLNFAAPEEPLQRDDILISYANALSPLGHLKSDDGNREGWEMAMEVLARLDDQTIVKEKVSELLDNIPLNTADDMDKVVLICTELGFHEQGRRVSERYGDKIAESSEEYGTALLCYARAHCAKKVKNVVDLLTSMCLIRSMAYPAESDLDTQLRTLIYDPKTAFGALYSLDQESGRMLNFYFCGYSLVRQFYDIRDQGVSMQKGAKFNRRSLERKRAAAESLVALIHSASDGIYGGTYDSERRSSLSADTLLVLLGEALVFTEESNRFLTLDEHYTILEAIEELETVSPRIYKQCEDCLQSSLSHHFEHDTRMESEDYSSTSPSTSFGAAPPRSLLQKSILGQSGLSGFSLIEHEMMSASKIRQFDEGHRPDEHFKREWDWRVGVEKNFQGEDIIRMLRLHLAKGLAFGDLSV